MRLDEDEPPLFGLVADAGAKECVGAGPLPNFFLVAGPEDIGGDKACRQRAGIDRHSPVQLLLWRLATMRRFFDSVAAPTHEGIRPLTVSAVLLVLLALIAVPRQPAHAWFGVDIDGGLAWSDTRRGITAEFRRRGLLTHEADGFRERGLAGSLSWDPTRGDRGPRLSLIQTLGASAQVGADALLGRRTLQGLAANDNGDELRQRRLEARFGYGFAAFDDRFTSMPEVGIGLSDAGRDYSVGWRLVRGAGVDGGSLEFSVEAWRRESANDDTPPEHAFGFKLGARF